MDLKEINPNININHWYYQGKFLAIKKMMVEINAWPPFSLGASAIVDVGAGSGIFSKAIAKSLESSSKSIYAVDTFYTEEFLRKEKNIQFVKSLPEGIEPAYLFFIDVLEHIENDVEFIKKWVNISLPNSHFLFIVPAFKFLWSSHDVFLEHKRRYNLEEFERVVSLSNLKVIRSCYFFVTILPCVIFARKIVEPLMRFFGFHQHQGITQANPLINLLLTFILRVETKLMLYNRLFGVSCILIAKKL